MGVLHADAADREGNVLGPTHADFLYDTDANLARASRRAIVTVERIAKHDELVRENRRTLLFGFEVAAVVLLPQSARPTAVPGSYGTDLAALGRYLKVAGKDTARVEDAMDELVRA